jgi:hypothetical protein
LSRVARAEYFQSVAISENDWRFLNAEFLRGQKFRFKLYVPPRPEWDHDHCVGCWAKFMEKAGREIEQSGYAVTAECEKGQDYYWICASCFVALKDQLEWAVVA